MGAVGLGASGGAGGGADRRRAQPARAGAAGRPSPCGAGPSRPWPGVALDAVGRQRATPAGGLRGGRGRTLGRGGACRARTGARGAAADRRHPPACRQGGARLGGGRGGQAAPGLRPGAPADHLLRGDPGAGQRHHRRPGLPHRARRDLRVRPRLLRFRLLLGEARRHRLHLRHPPQAQHPAPPATPAQAAARSAHHPSAPTAPAGRLPERQAARRKNPYTQRLRAIKVEISPGQVITLLTNDLKAPATAIAALYKERWAVELFSKWVKQNLRLSRFLGNSRNAITPQIIAALIAFLLVRLAQLRHRATLPAQAAFRLIQASFLHRRPLRELLHPPNPQTHPTNTQQQTFPFAWT